MSPWSIACDAFNFTYLASLQVEHRGVKALYTKLLFILTRCSRLLITEELDLFATEPKPKEGIVKGESPGNAGSHAFPA